ncbi:hypothetical protein FPZ12_019230 [Amycolatopsis acidicola]|uniref:Uncharacterized protein n=1 Tax=Amycolatopsis acidicola TaxID=2596893 RepID=A0A5N0V3U5_9PSEU|nr:hypothetical protein [Amycolatopsis acidicola]KAA9159765.1 hypothetical protein FPZ12_019230 [Amycolatopsis acidicola]
MTEVAFETPELAMEAADQLAAAVAAALRPDSLPLEYDPCRRGVGAAVERLGDALVRLIEQLETGAGSVAGDSAITRAGELAAAVRFARAPAALELPA